MKRKRTRTEKFLLFSPLLLLSVTAVLKTNTPWMRDARFCLDLRNDYSERRARREAGFGAVDCGGAMLWMKEDPRLQKVDGCAISRFQKGQAFRFRYDSMGQHGNNRHYVTWNSTNGLESFIYSPPSIVGSSSQIIDMDKCNPAKIIRKYDSGFTERFYHHTVGCA